MAADGEVSLKIKIKQEGQEALSKLETAFEGIIGFAKAAGVALAAMGIALGKLALDAAKFEDVQKAFTAMTAKQGLDAKEFLKNLKEMTNGTISEMDLMTKANNAMLLGLPIDRFGDIVKIAQGAAKSTGESMDFMLQSIVIGLGRQSKLILDNLGIIVDAEKANAEYAKSVGKTAAALTDAEKKQAFINETLKVGLANLEKMGGLQKSNTDRWDQMKASTADLGIVIGKLSGPILGALLESFNSLIKETTEFAESKTLIKVFQFGAIAINDTTAAIIATVDYFRLLPDLIAASAVAFDNLNKIFTLDPDEWKKEATGIKDVFGTVFDDLKSRRKKHSEESAANEKAILDKYAEMEISDHEQKVEIKKQLEIEKKNESAEAIKVIEDEEGNRRLRQFVANKDNEIALAEEAKKKEAELLDAQLKQEAELKEKHLQEEYNARIQMSNLIFSFTQGGLEQVAKFGIQVIVDKYLPGAGAAASQFFGFLTEETGKFTEKLNQFVSIDFLENFSKNLGALFEKLPHLISAINEQFIEKSPELSKALIEAIISSLPELISAIASTTIKTAANPKFLAELSEAVINGIVAGIKNVAGDIAEAIKKAISDTVKGSQVMGGKVESGFDRVFGKVWASGNMFDNIPRFASGGLVDNTLAMVTPGEAIINRDSTAANAGLLAEINQSNGRSISAGNNISLVINGGLLGDESSARQLAKAIDEQLYKLRLGRESRAFDSEAI